MLGEYFSGREVSFTPCHKMMSLSAYNLTRGWDTNCQLSWNCADIYNLGKQIGEEFMFKSAMKYFIDNFVMLSKSVEFLNMPAEMIFELVNAENVQFVEPDSVPIPANQEQGILHAVLRYVGHNENKRLALLPGFMQGIRLPALLPSMLTKLKEHKLVKKSPDSLALVEKALTVKPELIIVSLWSRPFAGGGQVFNIVQRFNDAIEVPLTAYVKAMKMHMRRWGGRQVWGGFEVTHGNGYIVQHGGKDYGHEVYEFVLGEVITSVDINAGFMIDRITFNTSKNRVLGPYGGSGGSTYHNGHSGKDKLSGYLVCSSGGVVDTQGSLGINSLKFIWAHIEVRIPEPIITASDYSDIDSGEDLSACGDISD
ncbi:hypothetical protein LSH36_463g02019 [Paralvinella palmiformis]|uniref:BACK domain-containing protein n=1 Tax=Paralvinella palmiformis TaxID=53620 RepID=A0AAD9J9V7_9ANNE|nr:hypothetical protein LSH36_463g02019 [Paralvinella palmiformis]